MANKATKPQQPATASEQPQPPAFERLQRAHTALEKVLMDQNRQNEQIEAALKELLFLALHEVPEDLRVQFLTKGACMADKRIRRLAAMHPLWQPEIQAAVEKHDADLAEQRAAQEKEKVLKSLEDTEKRRAKLIERARDAGIDPSHGIAHVVTRLRSISSKVLGGWRHRESLLRGAASAYH